MQLYMYEYIKVKQYIKKTHYAPKHATLVVS